MRLRFVSVLLWGIQRVDAGFLSQGDVVTEHGIIDVDVEGARPCRVAEDGPELVLVVGLCHENMSATQPAADRPREVHALTAAPLPYEHAFTSC